MCVGNPKSVYGRFMMFMRSHQFIILLIIFTFVAVSLFGLIVYLFIRGAEQLGLPLFVHIGIFVVILTITKKPAAIWNMGKVQAFIKVLGLTGTTIFFLIFGGAALGVGIWLLVR